MLKLIERDTYMNRLRRLKGTPDIKIMTGIRRCGKSELLRELMRDLQENDPESNIIYIDYADLQFDDLKTYKALYQYVEQHWQQDKNNYLFVDEVQLCEQFELAINSFYNSRKYDIYITGSNAFLLSSDLATLFTGRYIEIPVYPFSFSEYSDYFSGEGTRDELFDRYVIEGGLAGSYVYNNSEDKIAYVNDIYTTIVTRDLVQKYNIPDTVVLDRLSRYMMDNISNLTSINKISGTLSNGKLETNHVTIGQYMKYLCQAFMFYEVTRYDIKGKTYLKTISKYYLCDLSLRYALLGMRNMDYGRAYENLVMLELKRRGYEFYVGKLYQSEVDFIAMKSSRKVYIQVSDDISSSETLERELAPLRGIKDSYPKALIARTRHPMYDVEGIIVVDLVRWLLDEDKAW